MYFPCEFRHSKIRRKKKREEPTSHATQVWHIARNLGLSTSLAAQLREREREREKERDDGDAT